MKKKIIIVSIAVLSIALIPMTVLADTMRGHVLVGKAVKAHLYLGMQGVAKLQLVGTTKGGYSSNLPIIMGIIGFIFVVLIAVYSNKKEKS
jgi:hypothetical protein